MREVVFVNFRREPIAELCARIQATGRTIPARSLRQGGHWRLTYIERAA